MNELKLTDDHKQQIEKLLKSIEEHNNLYGDDRLLISLVKKSEISGCESLSFGRNNQISTLGAGEICQACDGKGRI